MVSMVERVARALALGMYPDARWPKDEEDADYGVDDQEGRYPISWHFANKCRSQARAAIEAMREPTEAMKEQGRLQCDVLDNGAVPTYQIMIDAALASE